MMRGIAAAIGAGTLLLVTTPAWAGKIVFEETVIEGEVQKPEVTVSISRENLNKAYDMQLSESFLPKIIESIEFDPF